MSNQGRWRAGSVPNAYATNKLSFGLLEGQFYSMRLADTELGHNTVTSTLAIMFHDEPHRRLAASYWKFWQSQQKDPNSARAIDIGTASSKGLNEAQNLILLVSDRHRPLAWGLERGMSSVWSYHFWVERTTRGDHLRTIQLFINGLLAYQRCQGHPSSIAYWEQGLLSYTATTNNPRGDFLQSQVISRQG